MDGTIWGPVEVKLGGSQCGIRVFVCLCLVGLVSFLVALSWFGWVF